MKLITKEVTCPICGNKHVFKDVASLYIKDSYLDGQPSNVDLTLGIDECPKCHYVTNDFDKPIDQRIKDIVNSQEYKNDKLKLEHDYFLLKNMYKLHKQCIEQLFWYKRDNGIEYDDIISELIINKENKFSTGNIDKMSYISYIDLLRQSGRFDDCKEALESLLVATQNSWIKNIIDFEKMLIDNADTKSHLFSEVNIG